jgi:hypothetical protein
LIKKGKILARGLVIVALLSGSGTACHSERAVNNTGARSGKPILSAGLPVTERSPVTWNDVASSYDRTSDYVCLYEKEERAISNGEPQTVRLYFRKPFDVRLE